MGTRYFMAYKPTFFFCKPRRKQTAGYTIVKLEARKAKENSDALQIFSKKFF